MAKINQQFIAQNLDLSITTVSRCFTNHPKINPETRAKVLKFAVEHGYSYNAFRNQKPTRKTEAGNIAVLVGVSERIRDAAGVAGKIFAGITKKAASLDYRVDLFHVDPSEFIPNMRSRRIIPGSSHNNWTGIILVFPFQEDAVKALSTKYHVISVLDEYEELIIDSINPDQGRGIAKMVKHLHELGHRKIGFQSWKYTTVDTPWVETRLGSYVEHLYRFKMPFDPEMVLFVPEVEARDPNRGADQVIRLMEKGMTGLVCAADHQAYELLPKLERKGIRVPEDLSITGYDGIPTPPGMPHLTTYSTPFQEVGNTGLVSLQRRIDHPLSSRSHILIDGEKIPGETTRAIE
jgi:LacI family transcriptional regulator